MCIGFASTFTWPMFCSNFVLIYQPHSVFKFANFSRGWVLWRGLAPPQIFVIKLCLFPPNTPFLLPVSIIEDTVIMRQLSHFRFNIKYFLASNIVFCRLKVATVKNVPKTPHVLNPLRYPKYYSHNYFLNGVSSCIVCR